MKILAFSNFSRYESSCALLSDEGESEYIKYITIDEERLLRIKHTYSFPLLSMEYCLNEFGINDLSEIDYLITDYARRPSIYNDGPGYRKLEHDYLKSIVKIPKERIIIVNHHLAHAAGVFYQSHFEEAAILIVDGMGSDLETQSIFSAKGTEINLLDKGYAWGPGALYTEVTGNLLGFTGLNGVDLAGKTMGLAPYGRNVGQKILKINAKYNGLNADYSHFMSRFPKPVLKQNVLNACHNPKDVTNEYFSGIAHEVQKETENAMIHFANHAYKLTNCRNLCISGGVGLNSVANGKLLENTPFEKVFINPFCSDTGISLSLALYGYYNHIKPSNTKLFFMPTAYTGKAYKITEIKLLLNRFDIPYHKRDINRVAELLTEQKIVGWFVGGSEIGPRTLGHRSILVDPRNGGMKDILNDRVKHRESFRPFAPAILEEFVNEYFPITHKTPFMVEVYPVKAEMRHKVPAVVHVDGSGRLQTVSKDESPEFYELIKHFYKLTGVPVILNTSFNDREPVVETPEDALITWMKTEIDLLVLEDVMLFKDELQSEQLLHIAKTLEGERKNKIENGIKAVKEKHFVRFSDKACQRFIKEEALIAEWHLKYRAKYELEKLIDLQKRKKERIIIYGTNKHTRVLYERLYDFPLLNVAAFVVYPVHDHEDLEFSVYPIANEKIILSKEYDLVLISSHEYQYEIIKMLDTLNVPDNKRFIIYDKAGDTLVKHLQYLPIYNPIEK